MSGALALAHSHGLNVNMHTLCATGGGAHKVSKADNVIIITS